MRDTSRIAWQQFVDDGRAGEWQAKTYGALVLNSEEPISLDGKGTQEGFVPERLPASAGMTGRELDALLSSQSPHKRTSELRDSFWVKELPKRVCRSTGENAHAYVPVVPPPPGKVQTDASSRASNGPDKATLKAAIAELRVRFKKAKDAKDPFGPELEAVCKWLRYYAEK